MKRQIAIAIVSSCVGIVAIASWQIHLYRTSFSPRVRMRILHCQRRPCTFRLSEAIPEIWDRIYVFEPDVDQEHIDQVLGTHIPKPDLQRVVVWMQGTKVLRYLYEDVGLETPLHNEIVFADGRRWRVVDRITEFVLGTDESVEGSYFVLQVLQPSQTVL